MHITVHTGHLQPAMDSNLGHTGHILLLITHFRGYLSPTNSDKFIIYCVETVFPGRFF